MSQIYSGLFVFKKFGLGKSMVSSGRERRIKRVAQFLATRYFSKGFDWKDYEFGPNKIKKILRIKSKRSKVMLALQAWQESNFVIFWYMKVHSIFLFKVIRISLRFGNPDTGWEAWPEIKQILNLKILSCLEFFIKLYYEDLVQSVSFLQLAWLHVKVILTSDSYLQRLRSYHL